MIDMGVLVPTGTRTTSPRLDLGPFYWMGLLYTCTTGTKAHYKVNIVNKYLKRWSYCAVTPHDISKSRLRKNNYSKKLIDNQFIYTTTVRPREQKRAKLSYRSSRTKQNSRSKAVPLGKIWCDNKSFSRANSRVLTDRWHTDDGWTDIQVSICSFTCQFCFCHPVGVPYCLELLLY